MVARTGGGKSLAYLLPPMVELYDKTVVIQPLRALAMETITTLKQHNIPAIFIDNCQDIPLGHDTQVMVVTVEAASQMDFFTFVNGQRIKRFIIDEAHQYIDDRTYMAGVARLQSVTGQFVFTTGSLSPSQQNKLLSETFNLIQVQEFREYTVRPELFFEV